MLIRISEKAFKGLRTVKQPGRWDAKGCGQSLNCGSGGICLFRLNLLKKSRRYACCV